MTEVEGKQFGRLTALRAYLDTFKMVECLCSCGNKTNVRLSNITKEYKPTRSCGCLQIESAVKHGFSNIPEYRTWKSMLARCYNPRNKDYPNYSNRGITVCDEWKKSFEAFYRDVGSKPFRHHTLDRKDNDKGYNKENCRWITNQEQANNRSSNLVYEYFGEKRTVMQWCLHLDLKYHTILARIHKGMLFETAIGVDKLATASLLNFNGITKTIGQWCKEKGIKFLVFCKRLFQGWTFEEAMTPVETSLITFSATYEKKDEETRTLEYWCILLGLDVDIACLRILRGENFEELVKAS